ncbi:MAG: manganese catalase family protein, partial [Fibrobacter sp.]|nr:manganese catalase family protein [Fibrobacter sp.]
AAGMPWNAATIAVKGDPIADLQEDLAAEGTSIYVYPTPETLDITGFFKKKGNNSFFIGTFV